MKLLSPNIVPSGNSTTTVLQIDDIAPVVAVAVAQGESNNYHLTNRLRLREQQTRICILYNVHA